METDEFTMSAFALAPDGRSGDAFAEISDESLLACFTAMAREIYDWLPRAVDEAGREEHPQAIELTLEWGGDAAPAATSEHPPKPAGASRCRLRFRGRTLSCAPPRGPGCQDPRLVPRA